MTLSEKMKKTEELNLERDLALTSEDMARLCNNRVEKADLGPYLDFLEEIKAFETADGKRRFYDAVFEL